MGFPVILSPHLSDAATITGAATPGSTGVGNLQEPQPTDITRFSSLTGMYLEIDFGVPRELGYIWFGFSNASAQATVRHRGAESQANLTAAPAHDATVPHWPAGSNLSSYARTHHHYNLLSSITGRGAALRTDGTDDLISGAITCPAGSMTMEVRVTPTTSAATDKALMNWRNGTSAGLRMLYFSAAAGANKLVFAVRNDAGTLFEIGSPPTLAAGVSVNATGVLDLVAMQIRLLVDGVQAGTATTVSGTFNTVLATLTFGRLADSASLFADSKFDEIRVWNVAHTAAQTLADLNSDLVGNEAGLVYYNKVNDGTGSTATATVGANLTITGATWVGSSTTANRWWRADITDPLNPAGFYQLGRGYWVPNTALWQASRGSGWGASIGPDEEERSIRSEAGQLFPRKRPRTNPIEIPFNAVPEAEALGIVNELGRLRGVSQDVVAIIDPDKTAYLQQLTAYGVMGALKQSNPRFGRWQTVTVPIREMA